MAYQIPALIPEIPFNYTILHFLSSSTNVNKQLFEILNTQNHSKR